MTREQFAQTIHWKKIIWMVGIINVGAMTPQLYRILTTRNVEGLSLGMFLIYFLVQISFSLEGYFTRNKMLMWCLGCSAVVSSTTIVLIVLIRQGFGV